MFFSVFLFIKEPAEYHPELQICHPELVSASLVTVILSVCEESISGTSAMPQYDDIAYFGLQLVAGSPVLST